MTARPLRVLSNIEALPGAAAPAAPVEHTFVDPDAGWRAGFRLFRQSFRHDVVLLDNNPRYLWLLCLLRWLWPFGSCRLVCLDLLLDRPRTVRERLRAWLRKQLLRRVDHFLHYFKDLSGYRRYYGIGPERSTYVPFKANLWGRLPPAEELSADGGYVFTGGRSRRDLGAFLDAMRLLPYPAVLLYDDPARMRAHGTPLPLDRLPANVRAVQHDGAQDSWMRHIAGARVVVLTPVADAIRSLGISTYLDAMALGKCVVITDGPATSGVVKNEALVVPPGDPAALAAAIRTAWEDGELRAAVAAAGRRYAEGLGGSDRLYRDVLGICARLCGRCENETSADNGASES